MLKQKKIDYIFDQDAKFIVHTFFYSVLFL